MKIIKKRRKIDTNEKMDKWKNGKMKKINNMRKKKQ